MSDHVQIYTIGARWFVACCIMFALVYYAFGAKPEGGPPTSDAEKSWFANVKNKRNGRCCDLADGYREGLEYPYASDPSGHTVYLRDWRPTPDKPGEYDVQFIDWWVHVDKDHVIQCPDPKTRQVCNPVGMAVVWVMWHWDTSMQHMDKKQAPLGILCFAPGNLS